MLSLRQEFPKNNYDLTVGTGDQTISRTMAITVGRAELQEDPRSAEAPMTMRFVAKFEYTPSDSLPSSRMTNSLHSRF